MKMFDHNKQLPGYLKKHGKAHEIAMMLLTFVIMPIVSILIVTFACKSAGLKVVQATVSMLAWYDGKLADVYIWGALNLALYIYLIKLNLDSQQYSKPAKCAFYVLCAFSVISLIVGLSIPLNEDGSIYHKLHNSFAIIGFGMAVIILLLFVATTYLRNYTQAGIMTALCCFFIITGVFAIPQVNSPDSGAFITAAAQMYVFAMIHVLYALNYLFAKFLPPRAMKKDMPKEDDVKL